MKLHKESTKTIIIELIILSLVNLILFIFLSEYFNVILLLSFLILIFTMFFFRVPKRKFERKENIVYAPCDGKIVVIEETIEKEFYKNKRIQVSIFMSPLNVHNNLYPISGKIKYKKYHPGKYLVAWHPKSSEENERSSIVIENKKISLLVRQIAGFLARRIITYSETNDKCNVSNEFGFIKFGSRIDLFLPIGTKIETKLNKKVIGGVSILASY